MLEPVNRVGALPIDVFGLAPPRQNPLATLDAIRRLDLHLGFCDLPIARGIVSRAIRYLEADLRVQLNGLVGGGLR